MADADRDRLRRLRQARLTGRVPRDLIPWLLEIAGAAAPTTIPIASRSSPAERLADDLGDEIDRWITRRGVSHRELGVPRRTLHRALAGDNLTLQTVAEIADALGCDAQITFRGRGADGTTSGTDGPTASGGRQLKHEKSTAT